MKNLLLTLLVSLCLVVPSQAAATIIHATVNPTTDSAGNITGYIMRLPQPMLNNNGGVAVINAGTGKSVTCTDDKSVAWTAGPTRDDGNQELSGFYTLNRTDGPQVLTCTISSTGAFVSGAMVEFAGMGALDKTCGDSFVFTAIDCATAATAEAGELIVGFATQTATASTQTGWTPGAGYTRLVWDTFDSTYGVYQIQAAAGVAQPLANMGVSQTGIMIGMTFRPAATGTLPTGMFPINVSQFRYKAADTAGVLNVPCRGDENAVTVIWNGAAGRIITGTAPAVNVSSTGTTGSWLQAGDGSLFGGSGKNQIPYLQAATCDSTMTITPTYSGGQALDSYIIIITWIGAATTLLDPAGTAETTGTDGTGAAFTGSNITATNAGWTVGYIGAATGAGSQVVGSPGTFIAPQTIPIIDTNPVGENQGAVIKQVAASEAYTLTWTPNSIAIGTWADYLTVFDAASVAPPATSKKLMMMGVGNQ